jgi:hypothetical protein
MRKITYLLNYLVLLCSLILSSCSAPQVSTSTPIGETPSIVDTLAKTVEPTQPVEPADIIFHNSNIITIEKDQPLAEAVAIRGNLIQAVGSNKDILALKGSNTVVIDLKGKAIMPGIIDQHSHYIRNGWEEGLSLKEMMGNFLRFGYTSETEVSSPDEFINALLKAEQNDEIDIRINNYGRYNCPTLENGKSIKCILWYKENPPILDPSRMVRVVGVKIFADGAGTPERGCPYYSIDFSPNVTDFWPDIWESCGTPRGDLYLTEKELTPVLQDIQNRGYRAAFHAMGDASIDVILNSVETVLNGKSNLIYRHQIFHNSMLRPDQMERYVKLNMLAQFGGMFNVSEAGWYEDVFGKEYAGWAANRYGLPNLGIHVSFGNDFNGRGDINNLNPFRDLYGYVTHKEVLDGKVYEPPQWVAKHKISVEQALEIMTIEPAFAVSMEDYIGSIKAGKYADLIIISDDPLTIDSDRLIDIKVLMTMVNGKTKYCAQGQENFCPKVAQTGTTAISTPTTTQVKVITTPTISDNVQTVQIKFDCDKNKDYSPVFNSQHSILTTINWGTSTEEQVNDFLKAVQYSIYVNGKQIQSSMDHNEVKRSSDGQSFSVLVYFDVDKLQPGKHEIHTVLTFGKKISDGSGEYGPGTQNTKIEGTCTVIIE